MLLAVMEAYTRQQRKEAKAYHREQMDTSAANQRELLERLGQLEARLGVGGGPVPQAASVYISPDLTQAQVPRLGSASITQALRIAGLLVEKAAKELEKEGFDCVEVVKLREAHDLLAAPFLAEPVPLTPERAATAYCKAREVRKDCPLKLEELVKNAALVVREVLVLLICSAATKKMSDVAFEYFLEQAFGKPLEAELRSQLHLARAAVCRIGRDRYLFERQAPKIYGESVTPEELSQLWPA